MLAPPLAYSSFLQRFVTTTRLSFVRRPTCSLYCRPPPTSALQVDTTRRADYSPSSPCRLPSSTPFTFLSCNALNIARRSLKVCAKARCTCSQHEFAFGYRYRYCFQFRRYHLFFALLSTAGDQSFKCVYLASFFGFVIVWGNVVLLCISPICFAIQRE